jgi:hypothetical protein
MIEIGKLVSEHGVKRVISMVEGETTVSGYLLLESEEFLTTMRNADNLEQVVEWVNENY